MSHDTHGDTKENKSIISFKNSFWLVIIIAGLFIAALNFVKVESEGGEEGKAEGKETHAVHNPGAHEEGKGEAKTEEAHHESAPAADTAHKK